MVKVETVKKATKMKAVKFLLTFAFSLLTVAIFAQNGDPSEGGIADLISRYWVEALIALLVIAEVVVRRLKTDEDQSVINNIVNVLMVILDAVLPENRSKKSGAFKMRIREEAKK